MITKFGQPRYKSSSLVKVFYLTCGTMFSLSRIAIRRRSWMTNCRRPFANCTARLSSSKSFTAVSCAARPIIDFVAVSERHRVAFVFLLVTFPAFTRVFRSAKARERKRGPCSSVVIIVIGALISATRAPAATLVKFSWCRNVGCNYGDEDVCDYARPAGSNR